MTLPELITDLKAAGANENTVRLAMNCYELGLAKANATANSSWMMMCEKMVAAEREACAKHAQEFLTQGRSPLGRAVGDAIRARGTQ